MTQEEFVKSILEKIDGIKEIYKKFYPDGKYLSITIIENYCSFLIDLRNDDKEHPVNISRFEDGEVVDFVKLMEVYEHDNV